VTQRVHNVAVIPGDGIGPELTEAALALLDQLKPSLSAPVQTTFIDGGARTYTETGEAMSAAAVETVRRSDATLKGPVGLPGVRRADGTEAGLLGGILRNGLDLYANVRPIRLLPGVTTRLRAEPGAIDYVIVRENTEGLYAARGKGVGNDWAVADTLLITREGSRRIAAFAFDLARQRASEAGAAGGQRPRVTLVDKANVLRSMYLFRTVFLETAEQYPDVEAECLYADAAAQALVMNPEQFDVIVTENMLGDILSDLGGGTIGGVGFCPGGNYGAACAYFEPIHGSAPAIAGQDRANPVSQILAAAMMLDHLGEAAAARAVRNAVSAALADGAVSVAPDGTVTAGTRQATSAVLARLG
jgi:isocitrate/isopropylmalate dehydrogenase